MAARRPARKLIGGGGGGGEEEEHTVGTRKVFTPGRKKERSDFWESRFGNWRTQQRGEVNCLIQPAVQ